MLKKMKHIGFFFLLSLPVCCCLRSTERRKRRKKHFHFNAKQEKGKMKKFLNASVRHLEVNGTRRSKNTSKEHFHIFEQN